MRAELLIATMAALAVWPACVESQPSSNPVPVTLPPAPAPTVSELDLRQKLGVPADAKTVIVFGQNAHLDIDWQKTFDDYYSTWVEQIFLQARQILDAQPRAFYSVAEMAYLQNHLLVHPEELAPLKTASQRGALRIVGGGMTSPDTLLPEPEMLFRDLLYGVKFAEDTLDAHPKAAWLPDSFGHAATVPDILAAAGFTSVAFSRIDGSPSLFQELLDPKLAPAPGSTAQLLRLLGSADFLWRGVSGAMVLGHFMAGHNLYCEGDNIDYDESIEVPGGHLGPFSGNDPSFTDGRIETYIEGLRPYTKTPYMFVPVGCDFAQPKPQLISYLDGYNARHYPTSGVWAVAAPFDDYAELVSNYADLLPTYSGDLTPTYMGFYGSRADLKLQTREAAQPFFVAETFATVLGAEGRAHSIAAAPQFQLLTRTDHHDFVTGTSADDVVSSEQTPLLAAAEAAGVSGLGEVASLIAERIPLTAGATSRVMAFNASSAARTNVAEVAIPITGGVVPPLTAISNGQSLPIEVAQNPAPTQTTATLRMALTELPSFSWTAIDLVPGAAMPPASQAYLSLLDATGAPATGQAIAKVEISNAHVLAELADVDGTFLLTSVIIDGAQAIAAPSMTITDYDDQGGLWRIGSEMPGCTFSPIAKTVRNETVNVLESSPLQVTVDFVGPDETREVSLGAGAAGLSLSIMTGAAVGTTRTVSFSFAAPSGSQLSTSSPAGWVSRPPEYVYTPTFWPAVFGGRVGDWGMLLHQSTGIRMSAPGVMELMAARDAESEKCDVMGGVGTDPGIHRIDWILEPVTSTAGAELAGQAFNRPIDLVLVGTGQAPTLDFPFQESLLEVEGEGVVSALKPAERGDGLILRALLMPGPVTVHLSPLFQGRKINVVDLAERDGARLGTAGESLTFSPGSSQSIASVRLQ
jgi:hypothetical protein